MLKSNSVKELKTEIAKYLNIKENQFIIRRYSHNGLEMKSLTELLDTFNSQYLSVYVEFGSPMGEGK
jgi:hypothetical protein